MLLLIPVDCGAFASPFICTVPGSLAFGKTWEGSSQRHSRRSKGKCSCRQAGAEGQTTAFRCALRQGLGQGHLDRDLLFIMPFISGLGKKTEAKKPCFVPGNEKTAAIYAKTNTASGPGSCTWPNGDTYEGEWQDNRMHGQGAFVWKQKSCRYEGQVVPNNFVATRPAATACCCCRAFVTVANRNASVGQT